MSQTDLVIHVPMVLQVLGILVELLAVHAAYGIYDQVVMQVARIDMCCHQYFKIGELFFGKFHSYGVGHLRGQVISLRKGLDEVVKLAALHLVKSLFRGEEFDIGRLGDTVTPRPGRSPAPEPPAPRLETAGGLHRICKRTLSKHTS